MAGSFFDRVLKGGGLRAQLARGAGASFTFRIGAVLVGFALHLVLARTLSLEAYGTYTYAFSWATVLSFIARLGYTNSIVRFTADYVRREAFGALRGLLRQARTRVLLTSVIFAVVAGVVAARTGDGADEAFTLSLLLIPLLSLASLQDGVLRGLKRPGLAIAVDGVIRPGTTIVLLLGAAALGVAGSTEGAMLAMGGGAITALIVSRFWERRFLPTRARTEAPDYAGSREWTSVSLALLMMGSMSLIHNRADVIMLGWLQGPEEVALYAAASRFAVILLLPLQAVAAIAAPMIAESYGSEDRSALERIAGTSGLLITALTLPAAIAFILLGEYVLAIFGPEFRQGYSALVWLVLGQTVSAFCGCVAALMTMTSQQNLAALFNGGTAALNLVLNWFLIPRYGSTGAAIATGTSLGVQHLLMLSFVVRRMHVDPTAVTAGWRWLRGRAG